MAVPTVIQYLLHFWAREKPLKPERPSHLTAINTGGGESHRSAGDDKCLQRSSCGNVHSYAS